MLDVVREDHQRVINFSSFCILNLIIWLWIYIVFHVCISRSNVKVWVTALKEPYLSIQKTVEDGHHKALKRHKTWAWDKVADKSTVPRRALYLIDAHLKSNGIIVSFLQIVGWFYYSTENIKTTSWWFTGFTLVGLYQCRQDSVDRGHLQKIQFKKFNIQNYAWHVKLKKSTKKKLIFTLCLLLCWTLDVGCSINQSQTNNRTFLPMWKLNVWFVDGLLTCIVIGPCSYCTVLFCI